MSDNTAPKSLDDELKDWRQGDVIRSTLPFVHIANLHLPLTPESHSMDMGSDDGGPLAAVASEVPGVVILSQTCDLIKPSSDHPFFEVALLRKVESNKLAMIKKGRMPRYALIPALASENLVADLDCVMTAEKGVLVTVPAQDHVVGCPNEQQARAFALALGTKRDRFAFPDDFVKAASHIRQRLMDKHGKDTRDDKGKVTPEGKIFEQLQEIRVVAKPSWDAPDGEFVLLFIFEKATGIPPAAGDVFDDLMKRFKNTGVYKNPGFQVVAYDTISAARLLESVPLTLDHLSIQGLTDE